MKDIKQDIILWAKNEGFLDCRFSKAEPFYKKVKNLEEWLKRISRRYDLYGKQF